MIESVTTDEFVSTGRDNVERKLLWQVLSINVFFFALEILMGFISNSMGLVADSLDMLADSLVYGLALFAIGGTIARKRNIAKTSGYFQITLAVFGMTEVIRRFLGFGDVPAFQMMIVISLLALIGNVTSLFLLQKSTNTEAHMQASMIFTSNDVIINIGVILAGILVFVTNSKIPDLVVGAIVFIIVARGAYRILQIAK
jgi:Co/Zn/Cd efflux system component